MLEPTLLDILNIWRKKRKGYRYTIVSKKYFGGGGGGWKLASKYKITRHARHALTHNGGSTLGFVPPPPPARKGPWALSLELKPQQCRPYLIVCLFESSWWDRQTLNKPKCYVSNSFKKSRKTGRLKRPFCFSRIFFAKLAVEFCE